MVRFLRLFLAFFCWGFFPFFAAAEDSVETLYLKLLLKKESEVSELRGQIGQLQRDVAKLLGREAPRASRRVEGFEQKASLYQVSENTMFDETLSSIQWNKAAERPIASTLFAPPVKQPPREGFSLEAEAFYGRVHQTGLPWALKVKEGLPGGGDALIQSYRREEEHEPGIKIGLLYEDGTGWDSALRYRWFKSENEAKINALSLPSTVRFKPVFIGGFREADEPGTKYKTASYHYKFELQDASLSLGKNFIFESGGRLKPRGGLQAAFLSQDEKINFANADYSQKFSSKEKQSFRGVGPYIGLDASYPIWRDFFIFDGVEAGYYMGQHHHDLKIAFNGKHHSYKNAEIEGIPHFINEIGLGWNKAWDKKSGFGFQIAYFVECLGNFNHKAHYDIDTSDDSLKPKSITKKNIIIDGVKASIKRYW